MYIPDVRRFLKLSVIKPNPLSERPPHMKTGERETILWEKNFKVFSSVSKHYFYAGEQSTSKTISFTCRANSL
jgi:hypothetical protein